ncbi:MAG: restriction endonuclease subunit S [Accumulibacter sp.]|jgi:type I restriction enzyme S subunit|uniref:restriction endonuclease subunit S n=1 Tax=Accumulibacter sp. TaxID=2053492 RepID=UPI002FC2DCE5
MTARTATIKDFAIGIFDGPHATPRPSEEGPVFLGIKNVTREGRLDLSEIRHVSPQQFPQWTRRVTPQEDDIVFSYEATLHLYARIPNGFEGCLGRRMALVRPDRDKVHPAFLLYYFLSPAWRSKMDALTITGATVNRIPLTSFPDTPVTFPSLPQQVAVAEVLSAYDDLIDNNRKRIALLEEAARLLYREWFVHLRFPGHEHVKIVDGVPAGWERRAIGTVLQLRYGKALKETDRVDGSFPVYGSSGIIGNHKCALVEGPAIVVGRKGNVGSVYWSPTDFWPIDTVYFVAKEQADYWLYRTLPYVGFQNTDAGVPGLNREFAYSRKILLPVERLRRRFDEAVEPVFAQVTTLENFNRKLAEARDLLLPRLMSGEITV